MYLRSVGSTYVSGLPLSEIDNKIGHRFWQHGGGYDRNIFSTRVLKKTVDYIHNNPVKAGLVKEATDWKWSSARYWILGEEGMVHIDEMQL